MSERELVFLSYAHEDLARVRNVYKGLKKRKVNAWFDKEDLKKGEWAPQILKAISRSRDFVICLSSATLKKMSGEKPGFQDKELQTAWTFASQQGEVGFTIIPVRLEACGRGDLRLSGWQQYDLFQDWDGVLDKLAVNLGGVSLADTRVKDERTEVEKKLERIFGRAGILYYSGDYENALSRLEAAINIKPDSHEAWSNKGNALDALGRPDEALEAFNKAIEIKPDDASDWSNKGVTLADLGRHDEALEAYNKAIEIKPDFHKAWYNKGITLAALGRHDEALESFNKAIEIKPDKHEAWYNKGNALAYLDRPDEALESFNKAIEIKPDYYEAWYNKGTVLGKLSRLKEALESFNKAIEIKPDKHEAWYNKGNALAYLGRPDEAEEAYKKAEKIKQDHPEALTKEKFALEKLGREKESEVDKRDIKVEKKTDVGVFISYIHENKEEAYRLCEDLKKSGIKVWIDRDKIKPGHFWPDVIRDAIKKGAFFIACFSKEFNERIRSHMHEELTLAIEELRKRPKDRAWFIPVLFSGEVPNLTISDGVTIRHIQWVDLSQGWDNGINEILSVVSPK
jgi:tetratricopeptide (TPR) repeat protein